MLFPSTAKFRKTSEREFLLIPFLILAWAFAVRLAFIFAPAIGPENLGFYWDSYHHWQVSYLSLKIGFAQGRLWDLGGMEYFWGVLPTLLQSGLMWLLNTSSIVPFRIATSLFGAASTVLLYYLVKRYFGIWPAIVSSLIWSVNPVAVVADASGMHEPLAILLGLAALWYYERSEIKCGFLLALATLTRVEFWLISIGVIAMYLVFERSGTRFVGALGTWLILISPYVADLWIQTGNPFYPVYWNFIGNLLGAWKAGLTPSISQIYGRFTFVAVTLASIVAIILLVRKKPRAYPFYTFFLGYILLVAVTFGFSAYSEAFQTGYTMLYKTWLLPYMFLTAVSVAAVHRLKLRLPHFAVVRGHVTIGVMLAVAWLLLWAPVWAWYGYYSSGPSYAHIMSGELLQNYDGGRILVEGSAAHYTYFLIRGGIEPRLILSAFYHPSDPSQTLAWMKQEEVRWVFIYVDDGFYQNVVKSFPDSFDLFRRDGIDMYRLRL